MLHYVIQWLYVRMYVKLSIVVYFVTTPSAKKLRAGCVDQIDEKKKCSSSE